MILVYHLTHLYVYELNMFFFLCFYHNMKIVFVFIQILDHLSICSMKMIGMSLSVKLLLFFFKDY